MLAEIDVETTDSTNELRIFRLKNAMASDVAPVLQDALNWQLIGNRTPVGATPPEAGSAASAGRRGGPSPTGTGPLAAAMLTFMTIDSRAARSSNPDCSRTCASRPT